MTLDREIVMGALARVDDPELRRSIVELGMVRTLTIEDGVVRVEIALTVVGCPLKNKIRDDITAAVTPLAGVQRVEVEFGVMSAEQREKLRAQLRSGRSFRSDTITVPATCRILAVASGKGGVGKSTVATHLAAAMAERGHEVGILDADVYGYSVPQMLGLQQRPVTVDRMIVPPVVNGIRAMSIGFFLEGDEPVMWRGPMLHRALEQFLGDVHWGDIDTLVVDMPPGTGDVALSLAQVLPRAEVVVVTTPQRAAQRVALRAGAMAQKMNQTVIGIIENMADAADGDPSRSVFGRGGGELLAEQLNAPLLATIDLNGAIREASDAGAPHTAPFAALAAAIDAIPMPNPPAAEPSTRIKKPLAVL